MEALILTCGTGGGHNEAAKAVKEELAKRGHQATLLNPYTLKSSRTASLINHAYIHAAQKTPHLFGAAYSLGNAYRRLPVHSPVYGANRKMAVLMGRYLEEHHFDVLISTHIFPLEILLHLKHQGAALPPSIYIATDYTCIPFTEESDCDAYVIPHQDLREEFSRRGIPPERIHAYGIPVRPAFREKTSRREAKEKLGLDPSRQYFLVSGGSIGAGKMERIVSYLCRWRRKDAETEILVICGNNRELYERLEKKFQDREIRLIGYTEKMAEYMKASRVFITKPGGLSITEAAVLGVPMIHVDSIPGCETHNMKFFRRRGMSLPVKAAGGSLWGALCYLQSGEHCSEMIRNQHQNIRADAAEKICDLAESFCKEVK